MSGDDPQLITTCLLWMRLLLSLLLMMTMTCKSILPKKEVATLMIVSEGNHK